MKLLLGLTALVLTLHALPILIWMAAKVLIP